MQKFIPYWAVFCLVVICVVASWDVHTEMKSMAKCEEAGGVWVQRPRGCAVMLKLAH